MTAGRWFRADVEGLRAVAVVAVLLFHARLPGAGGGFTGVDVFFVISGFLITTLLVREAERTGGVDLAAFFARRARRLLPVAALVLAVTTAAAAVLLTPLAAADTAHDALAAALQVANLHFAGQQVDYSAAGRAAGPLLHYWSLAVEEQFYLVWAPLVALTCRVARWRTRAALGALLGVAGLVSYAACLSLTPGPWAYLGSPSRAWQFAAGGLLAVAAPRLERATARAAAVVAGATGVAGLAAIAGAAVVLTEATPYPGTAALPPTLGTVAVIAAGTVPGARGVTRLLGTKPLTAIGRISYGWYLWHWPFVVLGTAVLGESAPWPARSALVLAAAPVAVLSHRYVEVPLRRARAVAARPRGGLALGAAATTAAVAAVLATGSFSLARAGAFDTPIRSADQATLFDDGATRGAFVPSPLTARDDQPRMPEQCLLTPRETDPAPRGCRLTARHAGGAPVILFGDSHAAQWFPLARAVGVRLRAPVEVLTKSGCPVAELPAESPELGRDYTECYAWRSAALRRIETLQPRLTIVTADDSYPGDDATPASAWSATFDALREAGAPVVYLEDTPHPPTDVPACVSGHLDDWTACAWPRPELKPDPVLPVAARGDLPGVYPLAVRRLLCTATTCPAARGGVLLYRDASHLTNTAATQLTPVLIRDLAERGLV